MKFFRWVITIKITTSRVLQGLTCICDLLNVLTTIVPAQYKGKLAVFLVLAHWLINEISHGSNMDGTKATQ